MLLSDPANMEAMKELAVKACEQVTNEKDKEYALKELAGIQL